MAHILFICTANICRSPVAEGLLRERFKQEGLTDWSVSSAGTWAQSGRRAARTSRKLMGEQGIDIEEHQAQEVTADQLEKADITFCMTANHAEALQVEFPQFAAKIYILSELVGRKTSISDPYGKDESDYRQMVLEVSQILDEGFVHLPAMIERSQI